MPYRPSGIARGPVVLVGDAAGYVEPFTGQGIAWALAGAAALDQSVADLRPGGWNADSSRDYEERWSKKIAPAQRLCAGLTSLIHRPRLFRLILSVGRRHPALARVAMSRFLQA
jgi:flavin-dependent dehydrogenase